MKRRSYSTQKTGKSPYRKYQKSEYRYSAEYQKWRAQFPKGKK